MGGSWKRKQSRRFRHLWSESRATQLRRLQYKPIRVPEEGGGRRGEPGTLTFKTEAKDYKYAGGEMYSDVYNLMRQPPSLAEYSSSRGAAGLSYAGGYYDHMCLAL